MANSRPDGRRKGRIEQRGQGLRVVVYAGIDPVTGRRVYERDLVKGTDEAAWRRAEDKLVELRAKVLKQQNASSSVNFSYAGSAPAGSRRRRAAVPCPTCGCSTRAGS